MVINEIENYLRSEGPIFDKHGDDKSVSDESKEEYRNIKCNQDDILWSVEDELEIGFVFFQDIIQTNILFQEAGSIDFQKYFTHRGF